MHPSRCQVALVIMIAVWVQERDIREDGVFFKIPANGFGRLPAVDERSVKNPSGRYLKLPGWVRPGRAARSEIASEPRRVSASTFTSSSNYSRSKNVVNSRRCA